MDGLGISAEQRKISHLMHRACENDAERVSAVEKPADIPRAKSQGESDADFYRFINSRVRIAWRTEKTSFIYT
ncbi:hypothetical protein RvVAR031_03780 [Agrobacterium vitis]|nr:hypothetical protein RvVAR031_03780 [Agrobacterium vitis]